MAEVGIALTADLQESTHSWLNGAGKADQQHLKLHIKPILLPQPDYAAYLGLIQKYYAERWAERIAASVSKDAGVKQDVASGLRVKTGANIS